MKAGLNGMEIDFFVDALKAGSSFEDVAATQREVDPEWLKVNRDGLLRLAGLYVAPEPEKVKGKK